MYNKHLITKVITLIIIVLSMVYGMIWVINKGIENNTVSEVTIKQDKIKSFRVKDLGSTILLNTVKGDVISVGVGILDYASIEDIKINNYTIIYKSTLYLSGVSKHSYIETIKE